MLLSSFHTHASCTPHFIHFCAVHGYVLLSFPSILPPPCGCIMFTFISIPWLCLMHAPNTFCHILSLCWDSLVDLIHILQHRLNRASRRSKRQARIGIYGRHGLCSEGTELRRGKRETLRDHGGRRRCFGMELKPPCRVRTRQNCSTGSITHEAPDPQTKGKTNPIPHPHITIQGHTITLTKSYKFLGVYINNKLCFTQHTAHAITKGTKYVLASRRMMKTSRGIKARMMKKLYEGVAVPKMLYAVDVWGAGMVEKGRGKKDDGWGACGFRKKMELVQRLAAIHIMGGMRSTATDTLFAHTDLQPIPILLRQHCSRAALRMATLPLSHPLHKHIISTYHHRKHHKSPLHKLTNAFHLNPQKFETIGPVQHSTKWTPDVCISVKPDKIEAETQDIKAESIHDVCLYSDGSGYKGRIGAVAVLRRGGEKVEEMRFELGSMKNHTVYEGEVMGMILAVELLKRERRRVRTISLGIDNMAAIQATTLCHPGPGHYLMDIFHANLRTALEYHNAETLTIRWTPGHIGIPGNEEADEAAKQAATGNSSKTKRLPHLFRGKNDQRKKLPRSKLAAKQQINTSLKSLRKRIFWESPRGPATLAIDDTLPSGAFLKLTDNLPKRHTAAIFQLCTGHAPLNKHLHRISKADNPSCPHCPDHDETVTHFLLHCPRYERQRAHLCYAIQRKARQIPKLLSDPKCTPHLLRFIHETKHFEKQLGDLALPKP